MARPVGGGGWLFGLSLLVGVVAAAAALSLSLADPQLMLVGQPGWHDVGADAPVKATCLDCHVPFLGTPRSRCLAPGCHETLATGTPPREGPAMPVRYHAALPATPCQRCHDEHGQASLDQATDYHVLLPTENLERCRSCHQGTNVADHARTDAVNCSTCHETKLWRPANARHDLVSKQPCDLCHRPPQNEAHEAVTGTCANCHQTAGWPPRQTATKKPVRRKPAGKRSARRQPATK